MLTFTNAEVAVSALPQAEAVQLQPLSPLYLKLLRVEWLLTAVVLSVGTAAFLLLLPRYQQTPVAWLLPAGVVVFLLFYFFMQEKTAPRRAYAVREHDVLYRKGWLVQSLKVCPFNRIQNCTVQNGPMERKWGLATLMLFTAGSTGADMRIPGLTQAEADSLRQFILTRINKNADNL